MSKTEDLTGISGETRRLLFLAVFVLCALLALHFTPLKAWMEDIRVLKAQIDGYGLLADGVFVLASMMAIALGVPRLALCGLAGALFGFVEGALVALLASVLGSYGAFLLARWSGRAWAERKLAGASERLRGTLAEPTVANIFIARQLPVPGIVPNVLLGIMPTPHATFLLGTFLGYLPSNAIVALAGSSLGKESLTKAITQVSLSMMGLAALSILLVWLTNRRR